MEKMVEYLYGKSPERPWEFLTYSEYFWHNFIPETLETWSRALKSHILA